LPYRGGYPLQVKGYMYMNIYIEKITIGKSYLVKGNYGVLIGYDTSCLLNGIHQDNAKYHLENKNRKKYPGI
jgi:hypothetical protein